MNHPLLEYLEKAPTPTGSSAKVPLIKGIENTVDVVSAHLDRSLVKGENIVVCGGGLSGCDFALEEAQNGKFL